MIIKVERIPAEIFAELVNFIDGSTLITVPDAFNRSNDQLIYGDEQGGPLTKIRPVSLRGVKQDQETGLYDFDIIISQLRKIDVVEITHPDCEASKCGDKVVTIIIPREIINDILDILDIFYESPYNDEHWDFDD